MEVNSIFQKHSENRQKLQEIFADAKQLFDDLDIQVEMQQMLKNADALDRDSFKVLVVGEFKRGKSTFINALLGEEVLPAFAMPCTAVINEIKYSEEKKAVLHFANPLPEKMPKLAKDVEAHIAKYSNEDAIPPMDIPVDRIEEFVVIPDPGKDQAESISESPFSLVEIFWPIDLCKNRVEIIDSPGLNEHGTRTKVTTDYLSQVDAVIFVLSCSALASQSELQTISDSIIASGHEEIFFVCNRFDEIRDREKPRLMDYAKQRLGDKTTLDNGIHFLSALNALDAKIDEDENLLQQSGFPELEKNLISFLVNNRGRLKLLRPAAALKKQINTVLREAIPMQRSMLTTDITELQKKYDAEKPKLDDAEKRRLVIREKLTVKCTNIKEYVRREVKTYINSLAREIPEFIKNCKTETSISFSFEKPIKKQCEEMTKELLTNLEIYISSKQKDWSQNILMPEIKNRIQDMYDSSQIDLEKFLATIDDIKKNLSDKGVNDDMRDVPPWERILSAGVALYLGGIGATLYASQTGFAGILKALLPNVAVGLGMFLLGITNPFIMIPALLATGWFTTIFNNSKLEEKLREKLGENVKNSLLEGADKKAEDAADKIAESLDAIINQADEGMKREIDSIKENVNNILKVKKEGEAKAKAREQILNEQQQKAEKIVDSIEELIEMFAV